MYRNIDNNKQRGHNEIPGSVSTICFNVYIKNLIFIINTEMREYW